MSLQADTTVASNIVTSLAVIIGGSWAYFKFVRGRAFANRAELSVSTSFDGSPGHLYLCITVGLKNTGLSRLPLNENVKAIRIFGVLREPDAGSGEPEWERIITLPILEYHDWLEGQETVSDTVIYRLPTHEQNGPYQVEAEVGAQQRPISRKRVRWKARVVAFPPSAYSAYPSALSNSTRGRSLIQRFINHGKE